MKSIPKFITLFTIGLILLCSVSCKEKRMLKLANGTFEKPYPFPGVYSDSSTQILYEAIKIWIDSEKETMSWKGGSIEGTVGIKLAKSDRGKDDELRLSITNTEAYSKMLPPGVIPKWNSLMNSRIYINPSKRAMTMYIIVDGEETTYYYVNY
jgi:hypothetical protein